MKLSKVLAIGAAMIMLAGTAQASDFATTLVASGNLPGTSYYNDPNDLLGKPTLTLPGGFGNPAGGPVSIIEPAYGDNRITTFNNGQWAVVGFDHQVMNDPLNPYGLDFIVYGNAFFAGGGGFVNAKTDHRAFTIGGGIFEEKLKIAVSQGPAFEGQDQSEWTWFTYDNGPYGDSYYPTNPLVWDPALWDTTGTGWSDPLVENDFTKPVNPSLTAADFAGNSYAAMLKYEGSAGGAGFDLAEFDLDWIQYIKVEGVTGFAGGEIDAFSDVAAVPIPGAVWLLGSGLLGLIGIRRRMRS